MQQVFYFLKDATTLHNWPSELSRDQPVSSGTDYHSRFVWGEMGRSQLKVDGVTEDTAQQLKLLLLFKGPKSSP